MRFFTVIRAEKGVAKSAALVAMGMRTLWKNSLLFLEEQPSGKSQRQTKLRKVDEKAPVYRLLLLLLPLSTTPVGKKVKINRSHPA